MFTEKTIDGKKLKKQEETDQHQTDSPACCKESVRLALTLFLWKWWKCNTIDVEAASLQEKPIERDVFVEPIEEFKCDMEIENMCSWVKWSFSKW